MTLTLNGHLKHISTIVFDLDDTLRYNEPHAHAFFCDFVESLGYALGPAERRQGQHWEHRYWASSADLQSDLETHTEGSESFWLNYSRRHLLALGVSAADAEQYAISAQTHMRDNYKPTSLPLPGAADAITALRRSGYRLGIITNRSRAIYAEMHHLGLDHHFDFYLTGGQLNAYKPSKEIFENMLAFTGTTAGEVLYVGDNYYADVQGARNAGLQSILLNWHDLYEDVDCPTIQSLTELSALLHREPAA
jgi:HAD superfamily hydrolase (TIGR01549 family)